MHLKMVKMIKVALAGIAQWIECRPVNRKVTGSIPGQGMCLGFALGPQLGGNARGNQSMCLLNTNISLLHLLPLLPSL